MKTTTIRVPVETRDRLNALAQRWGAPAGDVVARLVRDADDDALLADAEQSWALLGLDSVQLDAYRTESSALDAFDAPVPGE